MLRDTKLSAKLEAELLTETKSHKFEVPQDLEDLNLQNALNAFFKRETSKHGSYYATTNALVYRSLSTIDGYIQDVLCIRLEQSGQTHYLGNSSRLKVVGTKVAFGQRTRTWGTTLVQRTLTSMGVPMLPFDAFIQAGLKITSTRIIDQSGSEKVKRIVGTNKDKSPRFEQVHFTGASLFQCGDKTFLFDIDRVEIEHGVFNPFIVELASPATSIEQAYDDLIPLEVKTSKALGSEVLRQGEHFFIKMLPSDALTPDQEVQRWNENKLVNVEARLEVQGSRAHICSLYNKERGLVSGFVRHQGREHKDLDLTKGWYLAVPNTAARAFTITGDVD